MVTAFIDSEERSSEVELRRRIPQKSYAGKFRKFMSTTVKEIY
jgi:hypothetical protein